MKCLFSLHLAPPVVGLPVEEIRLVVQCKHAHGLHQEINKILFLTFLTF